MSGVRVIGEARLKATLRRAAAEVGGSGLSGESDDVTAYLVGQVRSVTPRRTGRLVNSVRAAGGSGPLTAAAEAGARYAPAVEYGVGPNVGRRGGHSTPARAMLRRGLAATHGYAVRTYAAGVGRIYSGVRGA